MGRREVEVENGGAGATGGAAELTVLDLLQRAPGRSESEALLDAVALAERVEGFGYRRFWVAEHQSAYRPAAGCPEVVVGAIAARTRRLRVGTAGVLLRYYSPLKVAETFRCLGALHPGRIDLGVARGHADDGLGPLLLDGKPEPADPAAYRAKVVALLDCLGAAPGTAAAGEAETGGGSGAAAALAPPGPGEAPEVWLLGAGDQGAALAAEYGTAFSFALFLRNDLAQAERAIAAYRGAFRPSAALTRPRWSIAVSGVCAASQREAEEQLGAARNTHLAARASLVGDPGRCRETLEALGARLGTRRFVFHTVTESIESRTESHRLLARAFGLAR